MNRNILLLVLKVVFSILLIGVLLQRIGVGKIAGEIGLASLFWIVGALILFTASHLLGSFQWMMLLSFEGIRISWRKTVSFYFIGLFFNNFFISSMGGDLFRIMDVRRYSRNGVAAVSTVFLDRFMGLLVLSGLAVLASPWILIKGNIRAHIALPVV
ncbi:flippase-like domain-containing protein, partial [bacterium]|nr:flippase-like domain-containing protein [bacterium]